MVTTFLEAPLCPQPAVPSQGQKDSLGEVEGSSGWLLFCSLLGGTWKMTRKAQGFVRCAGDLHPSFSGLAPIAWSNR